MIFVACYFAEDELIVSVHFRSFILTIDSILCMHGERGIPYDPKRPKVRRTMRLKALSCTTGSTNQHMCSRFVVYVNGGDCRIRCIKFTAWYQVRRERATICTLSLSFAKLSDLNNCLKYIYVQFTPVGTLLGKKT